MRGRMFIVAGWLGLMMGINQVFIDRGVVDELEYSYRMEYVVGGKKGSFVCIYGKIYEIY